ncbi:vascular endothelial zinc finger 1 isoform X2 [Paramormyrops kingsleyae]|uniref:vascular endothelial zinc finger 1 isoform X2 n=1 Tax=Paramormyrops kingsleyae TaxID=1676925 RepID=UPI003B96C34E
MDLGCNYRSAVRGLAGSTQNAPTEHIGLPPSTVDTAALNEEPLPLPVRYANCAHGVYPPGQALGGSLQRMSTLKHVSRPVRAAHICSLCNKQFKNSYNLRRHQSVHTGIRMKDRAARDREEGIKGGAPTTAEGRVERQPVPLSLLHLSVPLPPPAASVVHPPSLSNQDGEAVAMSVSVANVAMASPPPPAAVVVAGAALQRSANASQNPVRKNHACEACGKAFRDVYHLNRHRLSHSDEKPYSCPICQQRFKRKDRMSYHVRSHQGGVEKPYVCPHCAKGFSRPDHLNSHVRQVHSTERPFKCETCESAFATRDRLRAHMIRHEEKVPCHICGKLLSAAYISDHMRVHNQSQHHSCHLCNRSFTTLTYLRIHAQKHHGQEWKESGGQRGVFGGTGPGGVLVCQLCGVHCKTPIQLQGHMGTHNNVQSGNSPATTTSSTASSSISAAVSLGSVVSASSVFVSANSDVGLLVSDCSGIAAQSHS